MAKKLRGRKKQRPFDRMAFAKTRRKMSFIERSILWFFPKKKERDQYIEDLCKGLENEPYIED